MCKKAAKKNWEKTPFDQIFHKRSIHVHGFFGFYIENFKEGGGKGHKRSNFRFLGLESLPMITKKNWGIRRKSVGKKPINGDFKLKFVVLCVKLVFNPNEIMQWL
jgi:hypothetical protein